MSAAAAPIPYVSRPVSSLSELSALLSPFVSELMRHSNIKPYLDVINEIAFDNMAMADGVVKNCLESIEQENNVDKRLAVFYLFDTLCKNRRLAAVYRPLLAPHIAAPFVSSYKYANEVTRRAMDKLLSAWRTNSIFSSAILDGLQSRIAAAQQHGQQLTAPPAAAADPRKREGAAVHDPANKRARLASPSPPPPAAAAAAPSARLAPEVAQTLSILEQSLAAHPHLLPLLWEIKSMLQQPGADVSQVAPKINTLTQALQQAMETQTRAAPPPAASLPPLLMQQQQRPPPQAFQAPSYPPAPAPYPPYQQPERYAASSNAMPYAAYPAPAPSYPPHAQHHLAPPHAAYAYPRTSPPRDLSPSPPPPSRPKSLDAEDLRQLDPFVIASLYSLIPQQCQTCGFRCRSSDEMSAHLDYHFRLSTREVRRQTQRIGKTAHQLWYWEEDDWLQADDVVFGKLGRAADDEKDDDDAADDGDDDAQRRSVLADETQTSCPVDGEQFESFWDDEEEAWMYRGTVRVRRGDEDELQQEEDDRREKGRKTATAGGGSAAERSRAAAVRAKRAAVHAEFDGQILHWSCYQSLLNTAEMNRQSGERIREREQHTADTAAATDSLPPLEAVEQGAEDEKVKAGAGG